MPEVESTVVQWRRKHWITSAWELPCEIIHLLASSSSRYCKSWLVLCCWSMESKIKYFCSKTLQIIAVRLTEHEFIHIKFFKVQNEKQEAWKITKNRKTKISTRMMIYTWRTRERAVDRVYVLPKTVTGWRKVTYRVAQKKNLVCRLIFFSVSANDLGTRSMCADDPSWRAIEEVKNIRQE